MVSGLLMAPRYSEVSPRRSGSRPPSTAPPRRGCPARPPPAARAASSAWCRGLTPRPGASAPNSTPTGPASSATTSRPAGMSEAYSPPPSCSPRVRRRAARAPRRRRVGVERPHRHAGLHHRDRQRVVEHRARREAAGLQPLERERLDRRAVLVGVEPDVAEEDAVGPRHRPARAASTACGPRKRSESARSRSRSSGGLRPRARRRACARAGAAPGTPPRSRASIEASPERLHAARPALASPRQLEATCPPPCRRGART